MRYIEQFNDILKPASPASSYVDLQSNLTANFLFLRLHTTDWEGAPTYLQNIQTKSGGELGWLAVQWRHQPTQCNEAAEDGLSLPEPLPGSAWPATLLVLVEPGACSLLILLWL